MWELDCEEGWVPKNWCFWTVMLEKPFESPLDCKEIQPVHSKRDKILLHYCQKKMLGMISISLNLPRLDLWPGCDLSWRTFRVHLRKRWNSLFWGEMSCRYQLGLTGPLYHFKVCVSLLIFCLVDLSIGVSGVLKSTTIFVLLLISLSYLLAFALCIEVSCWVHIYS